MHQMLHSDSETYINHDGSWSLEQESIVNICSLGNFPGVFGDRILVVRKSAFQAECASSSLAGRTGLHTANQQLIPSGIYLSYDEIGSCLHRLPSKRCAVRKIGPDSGRTAPAKRVYVGSIPTWASCLHLLEARMYPSQGCDRGSSPRGDTDPAAYSMLIDGRSARRR